MHLSSTALILCGIVVHQSVAELPDDVLRVVEDFKILGVSIALSNTTADSPAEWILEGQAGVRMAGDETPIGPGDVFSLGEASRLFTGMLAARLVDKQVINWNTTIKEVLIDTGMIVSTTQYFFPMTLYDLLVYNPDFKLPNLAFYYYSSFFMDVFDGLAATFDWGPENTNAGGRLTLAQGLLTVDWSLYLEDETAPDMTYTLAAALLEAVTGKNFEVLLQEEVFDPLGMSGCIVGPKTDSEVPPVQPWGHLAGPWGIYNYPVTPSDQAYGSSVYAPENGVSCDMESIKTLLTTNLHQSTEFLSEETWNKVFENNERQQTVGWTCISLDSEGCEGNRVFFAITADPSDPFNALLALLPDAKASLAMLYNTNMQEGMRQNTGKDIITDQVLELLDMDILGKKKSKFLFPAQI